MVRFVSLPTSHDATAIMRFPLTVPDGLSHEYEDVVPEAFDVTLMMLAFCPAALLTAIETAWPNVNVWLDVNSWSPVSVAKFSTYGPLRFVGSKRRSLLSSAISADRLRTGVPENQPSRNPGVRSRHGSTE